ncbi:MAG TPA: L,D-transpeptidase [Thermohalobaculum sp.]|nr:L,D-transpeptidase [Thermohalobaculum sp.]
MQTTRLALAAAALLVAGPGAAAEISRDAVETASYDGGPLPDDQNPLIVKLQVLLDRAGVSPGVVDGWWGENVKTALMAFETREGLDADGVLDPEAWQALGGPDASGIMSDYTVTEEDMNARIVDEIPDDWKKLAEMDWLGYTSIGEMLAERFHMDVKFFALLNGGLEPEAGDTVIVAQPGEPDTTSVARIEVSRSAEHVRGFDADGNLVAHYPATVGSAELPSPSGTHEVSAIAPEPNYTFDPENIPEADVDEKLIIPPGPNGPVGTMWIDLTEPTYGLHGTPDPASIGKVASHGCVRLTNWDAEELAGRVKQGVTVAFVD